MKISSKKLRMSVTVLKPDVVFRPAPKVARSAAVKLAKPVNVPVSVKTKMGRVLELGAQRGKGSSEQTLDLNILPSELAVVVKSIRMILKSVKVKDNKKLIGKAQVYIFTAVADDVSSEPFITLNTFGDVANGDDLLLAPSGLVIYRNPKDKSPSCLDYRIMVMASKQEIRDTGAIIEEIKSNKQYQSLRDKASLAVAASNPAAALAVPAADLALGLIGKILKADKDHQIIYIVGSFERAFDQLGERYGLIENETRGAKISYQVEEAD